MVQPDIISAAGAVLIPESELSQAHSYESFRHLVDRLHDEGKVTGQHQDEALLAYSKLNVHRMNRWDKHTQLLPEIVEAASSIKGAYRWIAITEGWCGDSAQLLPVIKKVADLVGGVKFEIVLRDDHPELMNRFLTKGTRSIPIVICLDNDNRLCWQWGPRPAAAQVVVDEEKAKADYQSDKMKEKLHLWYARNQGVALQHELVALLRTMR
ncbi:MAG: thioredoxin family protein [Flavobacteriales bacterium]|nr:thioredoxin family protein [Flavobacteriales bacterium]